VAHGLAEGEEFLALLLITSWMSATGRTLRADIPLQLLTGEEL